MKQLIALNFLILLGFTISSCDKQSVADSIAKLQNSGSFSGSWELRELIGCQVPGCNPYFEKGNGNTWTFTDSSYQYSVGHELKVAGELILGKDTSLATGRLTDYFIMKNNGNNYYWLDKIFFEIKSDTLFLYRGILPADGTIDKYVRF
jgi:hypothetical protein